MDNYDIMKAIETVCAYHSEFALFCVRKPDKSVLPTEEVRAACRLLSDVNLFPFDPETDDISLMKQIEQFMNLPFQDEQS